MPSYGLSYMPDMTRGIGQGFQQAGAAWGQAFQQVGAAKGKAKGESQKIRGLLMPWVKSVENEEERDRLAGEVEDASLGQLQMMLGHFVDERKKQGDAVLTGGLALHGEAVQQDLALHGAVEGTPAWAATQKNILGLKDIVRRGNLAREYDEKNVEWDFDRDGGFRPTQEEKGKAQADLKLAEGTIPGLREAHEQGAEAIRNKPRNMDLQLKALLEANPLASTQARQGAVTGYHQQTQQRQNARMLKQTQEMAQERQVWAGEQHQMNKETHEFRKLDQDVQSKIWKNKLQTSALELTEAQNKLKGITLPPSILKKLNPASGKPVEFPTMAEIAALPDADRKLVMALYAEHTRFRNMEVQAHLADLRATNIPGMSASDMKLFQNKLTFVRGQIEEQTKALNQTISLMGVSTTPSPILAKRKTDLEAQLKAQNIELADLENRIGQSSPAMKAKIEGWNVGDVVPQGGELFQIQSDWSRLHGTMVNGKFVPTPAAP